MRATDEPIRILRPGVLDYVEAWELQRSTADARVSGSGPDTVILLEHPPVYTAGKRTQPEDRPSDGTPVVDVDRGGRITWHGPGQLVAYPIIKLAEAMNVVGYVRLLEQAVMGVCAEVGLSTIRVAGRSGVWLPASGGLPERKVAAIGVRVAKGVTSHGLALNCNPDLSAFDRIVPCGITDAGVTSLTVELGRRVTVAEMLPPVSRWLCEALDGRVAVSVNADLTSPAAQSSGTPGSRPAPAAPGHRLGTVGGSLDNGVDWQLAPALQAG